MTCLYTVNVFHLKNLSYMFVSKKICGARVSYIAFWRHKTLLYNYSWHFVSSTYLAGRQ